MSYAIRNLCHRTDISMSAHGFAIDLSADFRAAVELANLDQENVNRHIESMGRTWLDATGFGGFHDPDDHRLPIHRERNPLPPGPNARPLYSHREIRVSWGEWGPEHISVPGNACGLDIDRSPGFSVFEIGTERASLYPHNVDSLFQKYLLLIVFTELAESVLVLARSNIERC